MLTITIYQHEDGTFRLHNPLEGQVEVEMIRPDGSIMEMQAEPVNVWDRSIIFQSWTLMDFIEKFDHRAHWDSDDYSLRIEEKYNEFMERYEGEVQEALSRITQPDLTEGAWDDMRHEFECAFDSVGLLQKLNELEASLTEDDYEAD